jgi:hypothetical protein
VHDNDDYLESDFSDPNQGEESDDVFFYTESKIDFRDDADFYILCDLEDEETAEDIASYLGKSKKINLQDFRKSYSSNLYYRLNQFDVDGKNEVFGPILIVCEPDLSIDSEINLFPNPNNGDFQLIVNSKEDNVEITMIITDTYGRKVSSINNTLQSGINLYSFSNLNLNSGVYYIKILSNGDLMNSTRLIVNSIK